MQPPEVWAVCTICMGWPITLAQPIQDITQHIASTPTRANGMNIMTQGKIVLSQNDVFLICSELHTVLQIVCTGCETCEGRGKKCVFGILGYHEVFLINVSSRSLCGCTFPVLVSVAHILNFTELPALPDIPYCLQILQENLSLLHYYYLFIL